MGKPTGDPRLKSGAYRRLREIIRQRRDVCARCGQPIDYDGPRYVIDRYGRKRENPWAFDCGHIVDRVFGGTEELWNLQAEHVKCSRKAGAKLGARQRWGPPRQAITRRRW
jgi:hypothetical protein